jgi:hypothetical protein
MYDLNWTKLDSGSDHADDLKFEQVTADELHQIVSYADSVNVAFKDELADFNYNAASVKLLSDSISSERLKYTDERRIKVANLFGAFLGQAMKISNKNIPSEWIKYRGDFGVVFTRGDQQHTAFPINRVFRHIDEGDEYSTYIFFMAVRELLTSNSL